MANIEPPLESEQNPSILDPFRDEGIVGGLKQVAPALVPGFAQGQAAGAGGDFSVGDLVGALPGLAQETIERVPGIGDAIGVGRGLFQDNLPRFDRALQFAGVIGVPFTGVRAYNQIRGRTLGVRRAASFPQAPIAPIRTNRQDLIAGLSGAADYDVLYPTVSRTARDLLHVDRTPAKGYAQVAALVDGDDATAGFLAGWAPKLLNEVDEYRASLGEFPSLEEAGVGVVAMEVAKFEHAMSTHLMGGETLLRTSELWQALKRGDDLSFEELGELTDSMTAFAVGTQSFGHPEFVLDNPTVAVDSLDMDPQGALKVGLRVLDWERIGFSRLTDVEVQRRVNQMFRLNSSQMMPLMTENLVKYWDGPVTENIGALRRFRQWYPSAASEVAEEAAKFGLDRNQTIAAASILSAGELWETNVAKSVKVMRYIKGRKRPPTGKEVARWGARNGLKMSESDGQKVLDMLAHDDPTEYFAKAVTDSGSLKQPAFADAIINSTDTDQVAMAGMLNQLMRGQFDRTEGAFLGADARGDLPVVVDRHAYALALGFSLEPDSSLGGAGNPMFDSMAQSYRIAAGMIGDVDGTPLLPTELQAMTWMEWREQKGVTRGYLPSDDLKALGEGPIQSRRYANTGKGFSSPANWVPGLGPATTFSTNILDIIQQGPPLEVGYRGLAATARDGLMALKDIGRSASSKRWDRTRSVAVVAQPDGTWSVEVPDGIDPDMVRTTFGSVVSGQSGQRHRPRNPAWVDDVELEKRRIMQDTVSDTGQSGLTGFRQYTAIHKNPALEDGRSIVLNAPLKPNARAAYRDPVSAHRALVAKLRDRGVEFTEEIQPPHHGPSIAFQYPDADGPRPIWAPEEGHPGMTLEEMRALPRVEVSQQNVGMVLRFEDADQLKLAASIMDEPVPFGDADLIGEAFRGTTEYLRRYGARFGLKETARQVRRDLIADPDISGNLALAYAGARADDSLDPLTAQSYAALIEQTDAQFEFLTRDLGITVEFVDVDPYGSYADMIADVKRNKRLKIMATGATPGDSGATHPLLTPDQNNRFRAVHDFFGHGSLGNSFDRHGEEIAWARHSQMFSDEALPALTTETRAQNAALNFSPENITRKARGEQAVFADQKAALMPDEFNRPTDDMFDPKPTRVIDDLYGEDVTDRVYYVNGAQEAPEFSGQVLEHHYQDSTGARIVNVSREGDPNAPNAVRAYVPRHPDRTEMYDYVTAGKGRRHHTGEGTHVWDVSEDGKMAFDGIVEIVDPEGVDVSKAKNLVTGVQLDGGAPERLTLFLPEQGPVLGSYRNAPFPPDRTVEVFRGAGSVSVKLPSINGQVNGHLVDDVQALLGRVGMHQKVKWVTE